MLAEPVTPSSKARTGLLVLSLVLAPAVVKMAEPAPLLAVTCAQPPVVTPTRMRRAEGSESRVGSEFRVHTARDGGRRNM
jgi:hypothetical protein